MVRAGARGAEGKISNRHGRGRVMGGALPAILALAVALAGCSIPFGNGGDPAPSGQTPEEARRERNRRYQEEQQRMQRETQFDRIGPPSDR